MGIPIPQVGTESVLFWRRWLSSATGLKKRMDALKYGYGKTVPCTSASSWTSTEPPSATEWRDPSIMGTPASIACDLPQHEAPETCTRKRASANIFQGVGLLQLCRLFHSSGDEQAEERAQLVWECAGKQSIAQALQQLHKRQRKLRLRSRLRPHSEMNGGTRLPELQHFSRLRIEDCTTPCAGGDGCINNDKQIDAAEQTTHYTASHYRKKKSGMGTAGYLHQLHR
ncbi:arginine vasopressin-induced protein 1 isoform X2 [Rhineura floridana]|uniref:arginine vasopressin-induced protein 1 isoform X2 n=1 Tax=Rhineura floridana TaxID=261503 RepID=UPI002AC83231|nr:arginine vasopressin-induced protein 1 isoform X2 [Rhineura floridana]